MREMRVLNLYAGIGGNRKLWPKNITVTAVENKPEIAEAYKKIFPEDIILVTDAHSFLEKAYKDYNFIWSSPPCQTHSVCNHFLKGQGIIRYPDMRLYQEIIFLQTHAKCKWVVENVKSYYEPLIKPQEAGRHFFWANFFIANLKVKHDIGTFNRQASLIAQRKASKSQTERNCVLPELGLHVFNCAMKEKQATLKEVLKNE